MGKLDEDGFLYIVDRMKDMIVSGGQSIFPADIEAVMRSLPHNANGKVLKCELRSELADVFYRGEADVRII